MLSCDFMGLHLKNPFVIASGPWGRDAASLQRSVDAGAAAVVTETITLEANPILHPRIYSNGQDRLFNIKLFSDITLEQWEQEFELLRLGDCRLIASIWGNSPSELAYLAGKVERMGADAIEISISAPVGTRNLVLSNPPGRFHRYVKAVTDAVEIPVTVKLSYEAANSREFTTSLADAGADGISAIDALKGISGVDLRTRKAKMPTYGGYSGRHIHPVALATTATLKQISSLPVSSCGGIETVGDALEFIMMGAECVQLASVVMQKGYPVITEMIDSLSAWMRDSRCGDLSEIRGAALTSLRPFEDIRPQPLTAFLVSPCAESCTLCADGCLYSAISRVEGDGSVRIDAGRCTGCGFCVARCPGRKISLKWN